MLDCTWYLPGTGDAAPRLHSPPVLQLTFSLHISLTLCTLPPSDKDPYEEFCASRIPGSRYFDLDRISMPDTGLPHMLPSPAAFGAAADALGIDNSCAVVVYDRSGCFSAPRVWWTFRAFGHARPAPHPPLHLVIAHAHFRRNADRSAKACMSWKCCSKSIPWLHAMQIQPWPAFDEEKYLYLCQYKRPLSNAKTPCNPAGGAEQAVGKDPYLSAACHPSARMRRVAVLNGGLPAWVAQGLPLDETPADEGALMAPVEAARSPPSDTHFRAHLQARTWPAC